MNFVPITLPSHCVTYGIDASTVCIRPLVGKDEEIIVQLGGANTSKKIKSLFESVLQGIPDIGQITAGDVKHILLWEAINSYTPSYPINYICSGCLHQQQVAADLNGVNSVELPSDYSQPKRLKLSLGEVSLRLRTLQDEINLAKYQEENSVSYLFSYAQCIVDSDMDIVQRIEFLSDLPTKDLSLIRRFFVENDHGPDMKCVVHCVQCENEEEIVVPFQFQNVLENATKS